MYRTSISKFLFLLLLNLGSLLQIANAQTPSTATFLGIDTITQGSWQARYGKQGSSIANDAASASTYGTITPSNQADHTWGYTAEPRALVQPAANPPSRIAACWYSATSFDITVSPADTKPHQVALYCLDWDSFGPRNQKIEALDAASSAILTTTTLTNFQQGKYLLWNITGSIKFRVTNLAGSRSNSVVSAVFLDPALPSWWFTSSPPVLALTTPVNNKGPANIGQAKYMVSIALEALDKAAPNIATQVRNDLAISHPRLFEVPSIKTPEWIAKQKAPLLIGQLKAMAHSFYYHLNVADSSWVLEQIQLNHPPSGTPSAATLNHNYWNVTGNQYYRDGYYQWNPATPPEQNKAIATIGQLKAVFSLRFETHVPLDSDGNGLPDGWEIFHFGEIGIALPYTSQQPDGLTNKDKAETGLDPHTDYSAPDAVQPSKYNYDNAGRLTDVRASVASGIFIPDEEGNLLEVQ